MAGGIDDGRSIKSLEKDTMGRTPSRAEGTVTDVEANDEGEHAVVTNLAMVDKAIEAIGFGRYQVALTVTCGFGFLADQMLLIAISLVTPQAAMEFGPRYATLLSASMYAGLLVGALTLGTVADNFGRRGTWQASIFGVSLAILLAASSPNWAALNVWVSIAGYFGGGNLSIDLAILAESIPRRWGFILTGLASIWGLGNAITGLVAWPLLVNFGCPNGSTPSTCSKSNNMGWRYLYLTLGGLCLVMALARTFVLHSAESPRWLVSCGRNDEAADVLSRMANQNRIAPVLEASQFRTVGACGGGIPGARTPAANLRRLGRLFTAGPQQARLMSIILALWVLVGIAYPLYSIFLPYYLAANSGRVGAADNYTTYRDWAVSSVVGIFGPLLSMWLVSLPRLRSRWSLCFTSFACAAFAGAFTTVRTPGENLAFSCMINFWLNALYGVVYSYTPLSLNTEVRGMGTGLAMATGRFTSLAAPFIATFSDVTTSTPIWVACACFVVIGLLAISLPKDTAAYKEQQ